jgi:tRNA (uracil-5-)-methyltransferase
LNCSHFGKCGACNFYEKSYEEALEEKKSLLNGLFSRFYKDEIELFSSPKAAHRARAEFKIWHKGDKAFYAMTNLEKNGVELLSECPKVIDIIQKVQYDLLDKINKSLTLKEKLFSVEFLGTTTNELLVTMIYHKKLDDEWIKEAQELEKEFSISIIGRSRKQKIVLSKEYVIERLTIKNKEYSYKYYEGGFTQPNPFINQKMIEWAIDVSRHSKDLLELYCGLGNFTIPLSNYFNKVLATEISKNSIKAAKENCVLNRVDNIEFIRMDASDTAKALKGVREFRRLKDIDIKAYDFSTVLVDPPRAGLDNDSLALVQDFENIIYISCNPLTLQRDLEELSFTHKVKKIALFDQFPYTKHIESGVYLERI